MPLHMIRGDITQVACDAIVNPANNSLLGGGGADGAIHRAAGPELLAECRTLGGCETGQAKITGAYRLPCRYVIHTVGPIWQGGRAGEPELLAACYRHSLELAAENECETVAFPLISAGAYGYPRREAQQIAIQEISQFLNSHEMTVLLVLFQRPSGEPIFPELDNWLNREMRARQVSLFAGSAAQMNAAPQAALKPCAAAPKESEPKRKGNLFFRRGAKAAKSADMQTECFAAADAADLDFELDESFSQMLLRMIDERGMTDVQCYKKANIDRKLFSKIRSDMHYQPKKVTVLAFAIALRLSLDETNEMLRKAGFAFSGSNYFDLIVEYYISNGVYDIFTINEALFEYDQVLIGA